MSRLVLTLLSCLAALDWLAESLMVVEQVAGLVARLRVEAFLLLLLRVLDHRAAEKLRLV